MQAPVTESLREQLVRINRELEAAGRPDSFYLSLERSWDRYGSLTERQEAALRRSFAQRAERATRRTQDEAAVTSPIPTGRVVITGEILTTKWQENRFGGSLKCLVKSEAGWKVWGTVPASLTYGGANHVHCPLKGRRVTFTATVEPKEAAFGFFSRPTNARLLPEAQQAEATPAVGPVVQLDGLEEGDVIDPTYNDPDGQTVRLVPPTSKLADIIAKAKELEAAPHYKNGSGVYSHPGNAWDTDSMTEAA